MNYIDKNIIETYSSLFDGLSVDNKLELIDSLNKSLKKDKTKVDSKFYKSFGAFVSSKSPDDIYKEIKASRSFSKREIKL